MLSDFPELNIPLKTGKRFVYLDSAATTQKPVQVLDAVTNYYSRINANPHRGAYDASTEATLALDNGREAVRAFLNAKSASQIVFTKNATEALNLVAYSFADTFLNAGDQIVLPISEHHSNLLPWQRLASKKGLILSYLYTNSFGQITSQEITSKITNKTKLVAFSQVCNTTGVINPAKQIVQQARSVGAVVVIDGTQSAPHFKVDVQALDADFFVMSGHKMLAPMGIGVLYGKTELLQAMPPFLLGGDMVEYVQEQTATFAPVPQRFEAGTINVGGVVGLAAAIAYLTNIGFDKLLSHEKELTDYMLKRLMELDFVTIIGPTNSNERLGIVSFLVNGVHSHDVSSILNFSGVAIRAGNHCAQPFHTFLKHNSTCRASVYLYNSKQDIDTMIEALHKVKQVLA